MNKKALGIGLEYIVIAAIATLVLVVAVAFVVGGAGTYLRQITSGGPDPIESAQTLCKTACTKSQEIGSEEDWESSPYCRKRFNIDLNKNEQFEEDEIGITCYSELINVGCSAVGIVNSTLKIVCNQDACSSAIKCKIERT